MRTLTIRKETLVALTDDQLGAVVGGRDTLLCAILTNPCITEPVHTEGLDCALTGACA